MVFLPRKYNVQNLRKRANTQYWDLSTGSKIAYTLIPAKGIKKPCPIIYLHGGPGGSISDHIISILTPLADNGYDVYLYDQIGSGESPRLNNIFEYTVERHKKDLAAIIKKTAANKVILIGQSWGAVLAVLFTADNTEKIDKLIFTGPGPIFPVHQELAKLKAPDSLQLSAPFFSNAKGNNITKNIRTTAIRFFAETFGWKLASDYEADNFSNYQGSIVNRSTVCDTSQIPKPEGGNGYYAQIMTMHSLNKVSDLRPKLTNSKITILIMKGQCDNQQWGFATEYMQLFPNHHLSIIPNAGHFISIEQPEKYIRIISTFLSKV